MVCGDDIYFDNDNVIEPEYIGLYRNNGIPKNGSIYRDMVIKHSPNIIDLIEVGDYVNGYKVKDIQLWRLKFNGKHEYKLDFGDLGTMTSREIRTVVTKEQFESLKYKVGEDNE